MQLASAEAEGADTETVVAVAAACEPEIHGAAAGASTNAVEADSNAKAAPLTCPGSADATDAEARSALKVQANEAADGMQAVAMASMFGTSGIQMPNGAQEACRVAPDTRCSPVATPALNNSQLASESPSDSATAAVATAAVATAVVNSGTNHVEPSRLDIPRAQQSDRADKHGPSLGTAALPAPRATRDQTIPIMFRKRKAQSAQLPPRAAKTSCAELIDLVNPPTTPTASDTASRGGLGSGHVQLGVIIIDDSDDDADADRATNAGAAGVPLHCAAVVGNTHL